MQRVNFCVEVSLFWGRVTYYNWSSLPLIHNCPVGELSLEKMETLFSPHDLKRLELYSRNMADHHLITDLLPACQ